MPNAVDPSLLGNIQIPLNRNPLDRISYQPAKSIFDIDAFIDQIVTFVEDYLFPVIEQLTGLDLTALAPLLELLDPTALVGLLDPAALIELVMSLLDPSALLGLLDPTALVGALNPAALIEMVMGLLDPAALVGILDPTALIDLVMGLLDPAALVGLLDPSALIDLVMGLLDPTALVGLLDPTALIDLVMGLLDPAGLFDMLGLTGLLGGFGSSNIPDASVPGIGGILGSLFGGIFGLGGGVTGVTQNQGFEAVAAQTDALVGLSALVAQMQAGQDPAPSAADAFERVSTTNLGPTLWDQYFSGSGTWATPNGHDASWSGNFSTDFVCRYKLTQATTDAMTSTIVLGSSPDSNLIPLPANGHDDVWVRFGSFTSYATRTGVRLRVSGNGTWRLSAFVNGAEVVLLASGSMTRPAAGAILSLTVDNARHFVARLNGTVIPGSDTNEIGTASQLGAAFRSYGMGGRAEYVVFVIPPFFWLSKPGSMRQWTAVG